MWDDISDWIVGAGEWVGGHLSSGVEWFAGIAEGLAGIGEAFRRAGGEVSGQTAEEAARAARGIGGEAFPGLLAQVPIWVWITGGVLLAMSLGAIPNPFKR